jgi:phospholipid/cholesterol/gamma-HCH transport system substrate-binding protein
MVAAEQALNTVNEVGSGPMVGELTEAVGTFRTAASRLDSILANPAIEKSVSEMDDIAVGVREMAEGFSAVAANLALLLEQMRSPEGTVGRFLTDSTLYVDMHETMVSLRRLLDDVRERPGRYVQVSVF